MKPLRLFISLLTSAALLAGCTASHMQAGGAINPARIKQDIAYFSSPDMQGRMAGGASEEGVLNGLSARMQQAGLKPGHNADGIASWRQDVALWQREALGGAVRFYTGYNHAIDLPAAEIFLTSDTQTLDAKKWPIIYMGQNLKKQADLSSLGGAIALVESPLGEDDREMRNNRLRAAGARGIIEIVSSKGQLPNILNYWKRPHFFQPPAGYSPETEAPFVEGVMSEQNAVALISLSGQDWDRLRVAAEKPKFAGVPLSAKVSFNIRNTIRPVQSANVIGKKTGRRPGSGAVIIMAHWDHLGHCSAAAFTGPIICPGAVDNASGLAAMLAIAHLLEKKNLDRDVYFLATTAEEYGFAGARAFLANPPLPREKITAVFNLDMMAIGAKGAPVAILGDQNDAFDTAIKMLIGEAGLQISSDSLAQQYANRQDGKPFVDAGLPARMVNSSYGDTPKFSHFINGAYHSPNDQYVPDMETGALIQDVLLHLRMLDYFADADRWVWPQNLP